MNWWYFLGSLMLGLVIAWLLRTYLDRAESFPFKALVGAISIVVGGATLAFFQGFAGMGRALPNEFMAYPIGLFFGIVLYPIVGMWDTVVKDVTTSNSD